MAEVQSRGYQLPKSLLISVTMVLGLVLVFGTAPARPILGWAAKYRQPIYLQGISGTIWRGQAELAALQVGEQRWLSLGKLHWRLAPGSLLLLAPKIEIRADRGDQELTGTLIFRTNRSIMVKDLFFWGKAMLANHWLPSDRLRFQGQISLALRELIWRDGIDELNADLSWEPADLLLRGEPLSLGSLDSQLLRTDQGGIRMNIVSRDEQPLTVAGHLQYDGNSVAIDVKARPAADAPKALMQALAQLAGRADDEQYFNIKTEYRF